MGSPESRNNTRWNGEKIMCLRLGPNLIKEQTTLFTSDYSEPIVEVETAKDLGIYMDKNLDFNSFSGNTFQRNCILIFECEFSISE